MWEKEYCDGSQKILTKVINCGNTGLIGFDGFDSSLMGSSSTTNDSQAFSFLHSQKYMLFNAYFIVSVIFVAFF